MDRRTFLTLSAAVPVSLATPAIALAPHPMKPVVDWYAAQPINTFIMTYQATTADRLVGMVVKRTFDLQTVSGAELMDIMDQGMTHRDPTSFDLNTDHKFNYIQSTGNLCAVANRRGAPTMATYTTRGIVMFYQGHTSIDTAVMRVGEDRYALNDNSMSDAEYPFLSYFNMAVGGLESQSNLITQYNIKNPVRAMHVTS